MIKTNAVVISVNTMDGDLLNDVFKILNREFTSDEGFIVNRELHTTFTIFGIGNMSEKVMSYDKDVIIKTLSSIMNEINLAVEDLPFISIVDAGNNKIYVYTLDNKIIVEDRFVSMGANAEVDTECIAAANRLLYQINGDHRVLIPAGTYANNDRIVNIYTGPQLAGIVPEEILINAYRFLNRKDDKALIKKTIQAIVDFNNTSAAINRTAQTQYYNITGYAGFQPIMSPVSVNQQPQVRKPSPCPIIIEVIDIHELNREREEIQYIMMVRR
mgnify:FL=1